MKRQSVHFVWNEPLATNRFTSAVSLHSHTNRSREGFLGIHKYAESSFLIRFAVSRISSRYEKATGKSLDFDRAYFVPPLAPSQAYGVEAAQIEKLGLKPIVSITDHDTIEGV